MKFLLLVSLICLGTVVNACGPVFNAFFSRPPPPPTYYTCSQVTNGPPCIGSTVTNCVCTNGQTVTAATCPNDNTFFGFNNFNALQYCGATTSYSGYSSCTCAAGTWVPNFNYYQVGVNSNGQVSYGGFGYPYGKKKRSMELWEKEVMRLKMSKEM